MGSTSDLPVMEKAAQLLNDMHVPFEMNALSAHRTPEAVEEFAKNARNRGIKVIIAAAGMAAALPGVIAANTTLPVIGGLISFSALFGYNPVGWLCLFILIAGILGSARIVLGHHTLGEVLSGFAVGLICALLVLHPVSNILFRVFLF